MQVFLLVECIRFSEDDPRILGAYTDYEATKKFVDEYNKRLTWYDIAQKLTNIQMISYKPDIEKWPVFEEKKPVFDQEHKFDQIYKQSHKLALKAYGNRQRDFEKNVMTPYVNKKRRMIEDEQNKVFAKIYQDEKIMKEFTFRHEDSYYEMKILALEDSPYGN